MNTNFDDTITWYNEHAQAYALQSVKRFRQDRIDTFVSLLPQKGTVLDAGCGAGRDTGVLSKICKSVIGIDASSELIALAMKQYPGIEFITGSFLSLPFENMSFDGIWANASLVHLETDEIIQQVFKEFSRVLKPNGVLFFSVKKRVDDNPSGSASERAIGGKRFFHFYTMDELERCLSHAGFEVLDMSDEASVTSTSYVWTICFSRKN